MSASIAPPREKVFWHQTVDLPSAAPSTPIPSRVDVGIIGGGITGLSAARTFARHGAKVVVLEAESIGWGASSRNGGMVLTGLKLGMQTVAKRYGEARARLLFQCSLDAIDAVEQLVTEEKIDCGFRRDGHLVLANKPAHYDGMAREADFLARACNHMVELLTASDLREEINSNVYHGALRDGFSAGLNPAQFVAGIARAAERAGATLHPYSRVMDISRAAGGFVLETVRGTLRAERILAATAGYTGQALQGLQRRLVPIGSYIIATEPLGPELSASLIPHRRMLFDSMHFLNYFRMWEDRLVFGGRAAFYPENEKTIQRSAEILRQQMVRVFPQLARVRIEFVWGGTLDFAFDMMTHVGEMDGILYSLGYAGHGVAMGTYLGKTLAEAALAGQVHEHPFASLPLPPAPLGLYDGRPWFLPLAGLYFRVLDWLE